MLDSVIIYFVQNYFANAQSGYRLFSTSEATFLTNASKINSDCVPRFKAGSEEMSFLNSCCILLLPRRQTSHLMCRVGDDNHAELTMVSMVDTS